MKKYLNQFTFKNFWSLSVKNKIKFILSFTGLKKIIYNIIYFCLYPIFNNKSFFIRGLLFDLQKNYSKYIGLKNKNGERFIIFSNDNIISKDIFLRDEFDLIKLEKTLDFLNKKKKIENFFDIGANIGTICIPATKRQLVKSCKAVEPENRNFELLKTNITLNNLENKITPYNYALSNKNDQIVKMELAKNNSGDHRVKEEVKFNLRGEENRKLIDIKTKTFDSLFPNVNKENDLVWIDTQGHEAKILEGSKNVIKNKIPIVIEFWPYGLKRSGDWERIFQIIKNFKYYVDLSNSELQAHLINEKSLDDLKNGWDNEKKNKHSLFTDLILLQE